VDGDDHESALSFSDGRRTPLPPVEDEEEDNGEQLDAPQKQASFFTPEASNSPVGGLFQEKHYSTIEYEEDEPPVAPIAEQLPSPQQPIISA